MLYPWLFWAVLCCPTQDTYVLKSLDPEPAGHLSLELIAPGTRSSLCPLPRLQPPVTYIEKTL
ncbi:hypothetical protein ACRRTK_008364 [Alexandromys fortis]